MYEIAALKSKKLPELQEIAKAVGVKRITGQKKLDLIWIMLQHHKLSCYIKLDYTKL